MTPDQLEECWFLAGDFSAIAECNPRLTPAERTTNRLVGTMYAAVVLADIWERQNQLPPGQVRFLAMNGNQIPFAGAPADYGWPPVDTPDPKSLA